MKKLIPRTASALLGATLLLSPALTFAEEYTPFSVQTGGTGATTVEQAKENLEIPEVVQTAGTGETVVMSQKAVTDAIAAGSGGGIVVTQVIGSSQTNVMSQKATTDAINSVQTDVVQNIGSSVTSVMSQKAVTDAIAGAAQNTIVQTTGAGTAVVMSQKAVTDAINAVPQTTIVQTTGQLINAVMSQKAVTDSILTAQNILNMIYPVGSIYMSMSSVNPGTIFGGIWESLEDRVLIGASSSYVVGTTGGNISTVLTSANMPSHTHTFSNGSAASAGGHNHTFSSGTASSAGSHTHNLSYPAENDENQGYPANGFNAVWATDRNAATGSGAVSSSGSHTHSVTGTISTVSAHTHSVTGTISSAGNVNPQAIDNMPPYLVVCMWKRTA